MRRESGADFLLEIDLDISYILKSLIQAIPQSRMKPVYNVRLLRIREELRTKHVSKVVNYKRQTSRLVLIGGYKQNINKRALPRHQKNGSTVLRATHTGWPV